MILGCDDHIFPPHLNHLHDIQQIIQGIGAVPELMLTPEPRGDRDEEEFIDVRAGYGAEAGAAGPEVGPPSPKKPVSVQTTVSMVNFRQVTVSYSSSGQAHSEPVITGW